MHGEHLRSILKGQQLGTCIEDLRPLIPETMSPSFQYDSMTKHPSAGIPWSITPSSCAGQCHLQQSSVEDSRGQQHHPTPYLQLFWLVVSTHLKNISQIGNLPQVGVKMKKHWNHHLVLQCMMGLQISEPRIPLVYPTELEERWPLISSEQLIWRVHGPLPLGTWCC